MSVELPDPVTLVREVVVRLVRPEERPRCDMLVDAHHYLGFKQFAGRGLRYVAEWNGEWLALLGWQTGVFQCRPRDRWLGWHKAVPFRRPHLIGNNTHFLVLQQGEGIPNLASRVVESRNVRTSFSRFIRTSWMTWTQRDTGEPAGSRDPRREAP